MLKGTGAITNCNSDYDVLVGFLVPKLKKLSWQGFFERSGTSGVSFYLSATRRRVALPVMTQQFEHDSLHQNLHAGIDLSEYALIKKYHWGLLK